MRAAKKGPSQRRSPLYTSRARELEKRQIIRDRGKDLDGAYRTKRRMDDEKATS